MNTRIIPFLFAMLLLSTAILADESSDKWEIVPGIRVGTINAKTSEVSLIKLYGKHNVKSATIQLGEGETALGTVLFPNQPDRRLEIIWKNPATKNRPDSILIRGKRSKWKTKNGISLGTSLKQIERINGKPFSMAGFGWDGSGTIRDFNGGKLCKQGYCDEVEEEKAINKPRKIYIWLETSPTYNDKAFMRLYDQVIGERDFSSNHPAMQQLNPTVEGITVILSK